MKPQQAWDTAKQEERSKLRPVPRCPWWPFVWSQRTEIKVGDDGRVPIGAQRLHLEVPPRTQVLLSATILEVTTPSSPPNPVTKPNPKFLFSNLPSTNPPA